MAPSILFYGALLLSGALPAFSAQCNRNNVLRCLDPTGTKATDVASRSSATAYCSSYLSLPVVTSVVTTTTPVTLTTTVTTSYASTSTEVDVVSTVTVPAPADTVLKRQNAVSPPACLTSSGYSPSQISSACACLSVTASTTYVTATASPSVSVVVSVITDTTTTSTSTTTTTTAAPPPPPPPPACANAFDCNAHSDISQCGTGLTGEPCYCWVTNGGKQNSAACIDLEIANNACYVGNECADNADCASGEVCFSSCCGQYCVTTTNDCPNLTPSRLFRRGRSVEDLLKGPATNPNYVAVGV